MNPTLSDKISQTTVLRIEPSWDNNSAPALIKTKDVDHHRPEPITRTDETKNVTSTNKVRWRRCFSAAVRAN